MKDNNMRKVISFVNYGNIKCNLKEIIDKQNISRTQLVKRTGIHHRAINNYMNDNVVRFDKEILARLCYVLNCELNDIIVYIPPKE